MSWENSPEFLEEVTWLVIFSLSTGVASGLAQSFVWYRNGLKPYRLLIWFLCVTLGWSLTFLGFSLVGSFSGDSFDQVMMRIFSIGMGYSLVTSLPFEQMLREALNYQQDTNKPITYMLS
jgi:hypothetical protein